MIPLALDYPAIFGLVIATLSAIGTVLGVVLSGLGKRGDQKVKSAEDEFTRIMDENTYWHNETKAARDKLDECERQLRQKYDGQR
jgi:CRISPR/Cas system-associated protein Cas5 (RAMP superfamily)